MSSPSLKRIRLDLRELLLHPSPMYTALPSPSSLYDWHFTLRGPIGTDFEGGVYHGRILLGPDFPFKPPDVVFVSETGRFTVGEKVSC